MTREEAKREMLFAKRNVVADSWIDKAYDMAIQALSEPERKNGEWLTSDDMYETAVCSCCGWDSGEPISYVRENFSYCPKCREKMVVAKNE